jgi:hypothetical protein
MASIKADGTFQELYLRWLHEALEHHVCGLRVHHDQGQIHLRVHHVNTEAVSFLLFSFFSFLNPISTAIAFGLASKFILIYCFSLRDACKVCRMAPCLHADVSLR